MHVIEMIDEPTLKRFSGYVSEQARALLSGQSPALDLFEPYEKEVSKLVNDTLNLGNWQTQVPVASRVLDKWMAESGRPQKYTPEELAQHSVFLPILAHYAHERNTELNLCSDLHQSIVREAIYQSGLDQKLITQGVKKPEHAPHALIVVETSSRLQPCLTFSGASNYLGGGLLVYGIPFREILEQADPYPDGAKKPSYVSLEAAQKAATSVMKRFGIDTVLAETSAAPEFRVAKARMPPRVHICSIVKGEVQEPEYQPIPTPFRQKFDSVVRECMLSTLQKMYRK